MSEDLTGAEMEQILASETVARIGCEAEGRIYVVPVSYVYDGESIFGVAWDGMKVRAMRKRPAVCVEVDRTAGGYVESVIAWGEYEELTDDARNNALAVMHLGAPSSRTRGARTSTPTIVYRIRITRKTGRRERPFRRLPNT
jgi:nitroimidazol reductase NimA-like FMN-containing flavoprotein (pyridoxamine 5'-phosphate oxidase superfamily)